MLRYFGLTVTISIVLIGIVLAVSVSVTSDRTLAITRNGLNDQTNRYVGDTARELGARVEVQLRGVEDAVTSYLSNVYSEAYSTFEPEYSANATQAKQSLLNVEGLPYAIAVPVPGTPRAGNSSLAARLSADGDLWHGDVAADSISSRTGQRGVDDRSSWYVPGEALSPGPDVSTLEAETNRQRRALRSVDVVVDRILQQYDVVLQVFLGMAHQGLTRLFPGAPISPTYDPRVRGWYQQSIGLEGEQAVTSPYVDAFGNGWLISFVQGIFQRAPGVYPRLAGVLGADIKVDTLSEAVLNVTFRGSPAAHLTTPDGRVVASPYWDADAQLRAVEGDAEAVNAAQAPLLWDLPDSPVTESEFFSLAINRDGTAPPAATARTEGEGGVRDQWLVAAASVPLHPADRPTEADALRTSSSDPGVSSDTAQGGSQQFLNAVHRPRFVVVVHADRREALAPLLDLEDRIYQTSVPLLIAVIVGTVLSVAVANCLVWRLAVSVTAPLNDMTFVARRLTDQQAGYRVGGVVGEYVSRQKHQKLKEAQERLRSYGEDTTDEVGRFVRAFERMVEGVTRHAAQEVQTGQQAVPNPMHSTTPVWLRAVDQVIESGGYRASNGRGRAAGS